MHTSINTHATRFAEESGRIQEKFSHLLDIIANNPLLDEELYAMKVRDYELGLRQELGELASGICNTAHRDSASDRDRLCSSLERLTDEHAKAFVARHAGRKKAAMA